jgi:mannose/fructose/N-acetylgalactosamine-specific phosphotransferase system component IIB
VTIVLQRVDERLIHGQVVVGWGSQLHPSRYIVVDDELAGSDWEQDLYRLALDGEAEAIFATVAEAATCLEGWRADAERAVLLTRSVAAMRQLSDQVSMAGTEVNLGGLHDAPGRTEVASYLFVDAAARRDIAALCEAGVEVSGRDLPGARRVGFEALLTSTDPA